MLIQYLTKCVLDAMQFVVEVKILIECTIRQNKPPIATLSIDGCGSDRRCISEEAAGLEHHICKQVKMSAACETSSAADTVPIRFLHCSVR